MARKPRTQASRPRALASIGWNADFAGLPPIELPDGRKLETLADLRGYILALPKQERLRWNDAVAVLPKAAEHGGPFRFYRTGGLLEDTAWHVGRWSDTEGAGQERGTEGEATRSETLRNVSYGMQLIRVPSAHPYRARVFSRDLARVIPGPSRDALEDGRWPDNASQPWTVANYRTLS